MTPEAGGEVTRELADRALEFFKAADEPGLSALFDGQMKRDVPPEKVRDLLRRVAAGSGELVRVGQPVMRALPGVAQLYDWPLQYQRRRHHLQVVIRSGQIVGLLVRPGNSRGRWKRSRSMWREILRPRSA